MIDKILGVCLYLEVGVLYSKERAHIRTQN